MLTTDMVLKFTSERELRCVFYSLIVRIDAVRARYPGGLRAFVDKHHCRANRDLAVIVSMGGDNVLEKAIEDMESNGLEPREDFSVFDVPWIGPEEGLPKGEFLLSVPWLTGRIERGGTMVHLTGRPPPLFQESQGPTEHD